ncbi:unnamed protein product [Ceratitis capitata]|uniref:(Mediterranean fruit fly) hypothetical protein n=1 Tax=Ceratitis capitata TaxID=7213 RepID=A0A811TWR8_CERCA|nr:unnamed protein product [Ceratitis capitata]
MGKPKSSKAAKGTEVFDLPKSYATNSAARKRTHKYLSIKDEPIHVSKQGPHHIVSTTGVVEQDAAAFSDHCFTEPLRKIREDEYLLVQYRPTPFRVRHKVILESDVVPILAAGVHEGNHNHKDVFVPEGETMYQACVLARNKSKDFLVGEMDTVRSKISAVIGLTYLRPEDLEEDAVTRPEGNPWILIQYSADKAECSHTIMRYEDSLLHVDNPYPGYQVLTKIDGNFHHALIIFRSHNYEEVLKTLHNIFNSCVISIYPQFSDMSFRQEGLKKYQRTDLCKTGRSVVDEVCEGDLEISNQVANYVGAEASAMNKLCDQIRVAEETRLLPFSTRDLIT